MRGLLRRVVLGFDGCTGLVDSFRNLVLGDFWGCKNLLRCEMRDRVVLVFDGFTDFEEVLTLLSLVDDFLCTLRNSLAAAVEALLG